MRLTTDFHVSEGRPILKVQPAHHDKKSSSTGRHEKPRRAAPHSETESAEYCSLLARATHDAVRIWDIKSGDLAWPQGLEALLQFTDPAEAASITFWQKRIHPDDRAVVAKSIRDAITGDAERWSGEYRLQRADDSYITVLERALVLRDADGAPEQFVGCLMDITGHKQLHDQLSRAQKMEAFGQLAGGIAHDFNNFLTTILGYSDLLLDELGLKGDVANHVGEIRRAAARASALTSQLVAFSRKHPVAPTVLEVNSIITSMERSLLRLLGDNIRVRCDLHDDRRGAHVEVNAGEFTQAILNLAVNARDAMPDGGQLVLRTSCETITGTDGAGDANSETIPAGDYVCLSVIDNGCGMSDDVKARLFEPFFTTKDASSGLGLATTYGIVKQCAGHIRVASTVGKGTTVTIYLPKASAPPPPGYKRSAKKLPTGTETLLVLEDDVSVRHISVRVLRSLGYKVLEAATGDDAQRLLREGGESKIHLLLTDIMMPEMSGHDFAAWLSNESPDTKVIFVSGYLDHSIKFATNPAQEFYFLPKPFDPEQLAQKVREALDAQTVGA